MDIRPTDAHKVDRTTSRRAHRPEGPAPERAEVRAPGERVAPRDEVEISQDARALLGADEPETGNLEPERIQEILQRIRDHFYQEPQVRDVVLKLIAQDLEPGADPSFS